MAADLLVRNVRPLGGDLADILILAGRIVGGPAPNGVPVLDGDGRIALPGLVEAHTHLDKSLLGLPWHRNEVGPRLIDKIENERKVRKSLPIDPRRQSELQARLSVSHGTTFIRSHVDVDTECGVSGIEGVMATREALADIVDIDLVAFPQSGMLVRPGTVELLEHALRLGAETVGGLDPCAIDRDPKGHVDTVFGLAEKFGCGVDIHLHEPGEMGAFSMELIIERTIALGMQREGDGQPRILPWYAGCSGGGCADRCAGGGADRDHDHGLGLATRAATQALGPGWCGGVRRIGRHPRHVGTIWQRGHAGAGDVRGTALQPSPRR
jgi:cytosine/adenosine deaminase-related metal-dependent hydrolase